MPGNALRLLERILHLRQHSLASSNCITIDQQQPVITSPCYVFTALISTPVSSRCTYRAIAQLYTKPEDPKGNKVCSVPCNYIWMIACGVTTQTCRLSMSVLNLSLSRTCSSCLAWACTRAEGWLRRASSRACSCSFACTYNNNMPDIQCTPLDCLRANLQLPVMNGVSVSEQVTESNGKQH